MKGTAEKPPQDISAQQRLVLEQKYVALAQSQTTATQLDAKLSSTLQTNGLVLSAFGLLALIDVHSTTSPRLEPQHWLALGAMALFACSLVAVTLATAPKNYAYAGALDWDGIWDQTLHVPLEAAFLQILSDVSSATERARDINARKAHALKWVSWLLVMQLVMLLIANGLRFP